MCHQGQERESWSLLSPDITENRVVTASCPAGDRKKGAAWPETRTIFSGLEREQPSGLGSGVLLLVFRVLSALGYPEDHVPLVDVENVSLTPWNEDLAGLYQSHTLLHTKESIPAFDSWRPVVFQAF